MDNIWTFGRKCETLWKETDNIWKQKKYWTIYVWHMDETMMTEWKIHGK